MSDFPKVSVHDVDWNLISVQTECGSIIINMVGARILADRLVAAVGCERVDSWMERAEAAESTIERALELLCDCGAKQGDIHSPFCSRRLGLVAGTKRLTELKSTPVHPEVVKDYKPSEILTVHVRNFAGMRSQKETAV